MDESVVTKIFWRDGSYKSIRVSPLMNTLDVCEVMARNTKMEGFHRHLSLYERNGSDTTLYKATERYIDHKELILPMILRWDLLPSFSKENSLICALRPDSRTRMSQRLTLKCQPIRVAQETWKASKKREMDRRMPSFGFGSSLQTYPDPIMAKLPAPIHTTRTPITQLPPPFFSLPPPLLSPPPMSYRLSQSDASPIEGEEELEQIMSSFLYNTDYSNTDPDAIVNKLVH